MHYLTPTDDNEAQVARMRELGIFASTATEVGRIIVADVDRARVEDLARPDRSALRDLIDGAAATPA